MNQSANPPRSTDVALAGGGIIGLSLGLELLRRGLSVTVVERDRAMSSASAAAGGMLAVDDPQNPPALLPLARRSRELYPEYLAHIEALSGLPVPLRTHQTLQRVSSDRHANLIATRAHLADLASGLDPSGHNFELLDEASLDPRDLCAALARAFVAAGGTMIEDTELLRVESSAAAVLLRTSRQLISAAMFVNCCGAWAGSITGVRAFPVIPVVPVKGQMVNLHCAPDRLRAVVRAPGIYLIPRGDGRVAVGATIEHVGFDQEVRPAAIQPLIRAARALLPEAQPLDPPQMWAGLRPGTPDGLPILGPFAEGSGRFVDGVAADAHCFHATGHYRDGILLAPVTARVMAQLMLGEPLDVGLAPYSSERFRVAPSESAGVTLLQPVRAR